MTDYLNMSVEYFQTLNGARGDGFVNSIYEAAESEPSVNDRPGRKKWMAARSLVALINETVTLASDVETPTRSTPFVAAFVGCAAQLAPLLSQYYDQYGYAQSSAPAHETKE